MFVKKRQWNALTLDDLISGIMHLLANRRANVREVITLGGGGGGLKVAQ